jgi:RimJ/RimL family protein N-acetyltransferase
MAFSYDLASYPKRVMLLDESVVLLKPLTSEDRDGLAQFFERISEDDRFYLKEDVTATEVIEAWTHEIDLERVVPIIAVTEDGSVIADATLHRSRSKARRHIGELRIVVDPAYRNRGLGTRLIRELLDIAQDLGLEKATFELAERREEAAIEAAIRTGFELVATLPEWLRDPAGAPEDLTILQMRLTNMRPWWRFIY